MTNEEQSALEVLVNASEKDKLQAIKELLTSYMEDLL